MPIIGKKENKMAQKRYSLTERLLESQLGRYEIVRLALEWIYAREYDEEFRKLSQQNLIERAISDVLDGIVTPESIEEFRNKRKAREDKAESMAQTHQTENAESLSFAKEAQSEELAVGADEKKDMREVDFEDQEDEDADLQEDFEDEEPEDDELDEEDDPQEEIEE
jgi:hypothetical protein